MSDKRNQGQNTHNSITANNFAELLPLDLEATHERLERLSERWARQLPQVKSLVRYVRALADASSPEKPTNPHHKPEGEEDR